MGLYYATRKINDDLFLQVQEYLEILKKPYEEQPGKDHWRKPGPGVRRGIEMLSCSS